MVTKFLNSNPVLIGALSRHHKPLTKPGAHSLDLLLEGTLSPTDEILFSPSIGPYSRILIAHYNTMLNHLESRSDPYLREARGPYGAPIPKTGGPP